jgi:hypothetical protein
MIGLDRMDEIGRRSRRGQGGRDLGADMAALADAGDDDATGNRRQKRHRFRERRSQPILQRLGQGTETGGLDTNRPESGLNGCFRVHAIVFVAS